MVIRRYVCALLACGLVLALAAGGTSGCKPKPITNTDEPTSSVPATSTSSSEATPLPAGDGSATSTTVPAKPMVIRVYLIRGEKLGVSAREIPATKAVATAAVRELLKAPSEAEVAYGLGTAVPRGTGLRGVTVTAGTATVNLTGEYDSGGGTLSMSMRLAQVVYTLTQFSTIERVRFEMDGKPVTVFGGEGIMLDKPQTRADYEELTPAILIEAPTPGQSAKSPIRVTGTANTFEADFIAEIRDDKGKVITQTFQHATSGTGTRGTFDFKITYTVDKTVMGALVLYEDSAKDGSPINVVKIPLKLIP